jgi:hypothetical protein
VAILCRIDSVDQLRFAGLPRCGGCVLGVALRGWACARRDRSGGKGFRADARWGLGCCDPMLATAQPRCRRCVVGVWVGFCWGQGDWCVGRVRFLGLCGVGPALAVIVREVMAFALTRDGDWVAAILCSLRPSPAAAGVWSGCGWVLIGDRGLGLLGGLLGVASRGWACARRDRSGGDGFRADARWGLGGCDPMLATAQPRCRWCVVGVWVGFLLGTGDWDCWVGSWGGFAGLGLRSQGSFGR